MSLESEYEARNNEEKGRWINRETYKHRCFDLVRELKELRAVVAQQGKDPEAKGGDMRTGFRELYHEKCIELRALRVKLEDKTKGESMSLTELKCTKKAWITLAKTALTAHCQTRKDCYGCILSVGQDAQRNIEGSEVGRRSDCQYRQLLRAEITEDV